MQFHHFYVHEGAVLLRQEQDTSELPDEALRRAGLDLLTLRAGAEEAIHASVATGLHFGIRLGLADPEGPPPWLAEYLERKPGHLFTIAGPDGSSLLVTEVLSDGDLDDDEGRLLGILIEASDPASRSGDELLPPAQHFQTMDEIVWSRPAALSVFLASRPASRELAAAVTEYATCFGAVVLQEEAGEPGS